MSITSLDTEETIESLDNTEEETEVLLKYVDIKAEKDTDKRVIRFPISYIKRINMLWVAIKGELCKYELDEPLEIPINYEDLKVCFDYLKLLEDNQQEPKVIPQPFQHLQMEKNTSSIEANFVNELWTKRQLFFSVMESTHYLDFNALFMLCTTKIGTIIKTTPLDILEDVLLNK